VHGQLALNIFISGKILMPGRNNFNPTLLGRSMKNQLSRAQRIVRCRLNETVRVNAKTQRQSSAGGQPAIA